MKKKLQISRVDSSSTFKVDDLPTNRFIVLGKQAKSFSTIHTIWLNKTTYSNCTVTAKTKLSGYCYYSFVVCADQGIIGIVIYSYLDKTKVSNNSVVVKRNMQVVGPVSEHYEPHFFLESLNLFVYHSDFGSVLLLPEFVTSAIALVKDV